jgi:hypothetical protein
MPLKLLYKYVRETLYWPKRIVDLGNHFFPAKLHVFTRERKSGRLQAALQKHPCVRQFRANQLGAR